VRVEASRPLARFATSSGLQIRVSGACSSPLEQHKNLDLRDRHSTIITTNLEYDEWHNFLGNKPMVEALLSRLRHYCHTIHIKGPSLRDP
jgi:hypothetical protein